MSTTLYMTDTTSVPFANNTNGDGTTTTVANVSANDLLSFNAGSQGSGSLAWTVDTASTEATCFFQTAANALNGWGCAAGTWTINLNFTGSPGLVQVNSIYIVRLNSSGALVGVLGSLTGIGTGVSSGMSFNVTVAAVAAFAAGDVLNVIVNLTCNIGPSSGTTVDTQSFVTTLQQVTTTVGPPIAEDGLLVEVVDWW